MSKELPFESPGLVVLTVSELTAQIKQSLEGGFPNVCVLGEISQWKQAASGHIYLTLKDEGAVLSAAIWRNVAAGIPFSLEEGLQVVAAGHIEVYPPRGGYQLIVTELQPRGVGALQLAFRQLVERLEKEGLFRPEHKVPLPRYPRRIAVVTSPTGAALWDIIRVIRRRWPPAEIYVMPVRVQGEGAAQEIAAAVRRVNEARPDMDLLIVARGGGSIEDLWAFNEEVVARAIYDSRLPVISGVGHEVDVTISDLVADLRAATPTEAAEKAVPDVREASRSLNHLARRIAARLLHQARNARQRLDAVAGRPAMRRPDALLKERAQRLDELLEAMHVRTDHWLQLCREALRGSEGRLEALSPLKVLQRGYSITMGPDGAVLHSPDQVHAGDDIRSRIHRGEIRSTVVSARGAADALSQTLDEGEAGNGRRPAQQ